MGDALEFVGHALENYGVGTTLMIVILAAAGYATRELWKRNQELGVEYRAALENEAQKRSEMRDAHEREIAALREELRVKAEEYAQRLDELQEKRVTEAQETVREAVGIVSETRAAVAQSTEALTYLRDLIKEQGRAT